MRVERSFRSRNRTQRRIGGALVAYGAGILTAAGGPWIWLAAFAALVGVMVAAW